MCTHCSAFFWGLQSVDVQAYVNIKSTTVTGAPYRDVLQEKISSSIAWKWPEKAAHVLFHLSFLPTPLFGVKCKISSVYHNYKEAQISRSSYIKKEEHGDNRNTRQITTYFIRCIGSEIAVYHKSNRILNKKQYICRLVDRTWIDGEEEEGKWRKTKNEEIVF